MKGRIWSLYGVLPVLAAVCAVAAVCMWCSRSGGVSVDIGFDNRIELTSQEIRRIEQIGEWELLSIRSEVVVDTLRKGFFSDDRLVAIYTGTPRIGVDLKRVEEEWVHTDGDTVNLLLPSVRLLDERFVDEARTKVFYESGTWSNQARKEMYERARRKMLEQCVTQERLLQAEENARKQFTVMFQTLGFRVVNIKFVKK